MNGEVLWNDIIARLSPAGEEFETKTGLWFRASSENGNVYVDQAFNHSRLSKISMKRPISKREFLVVYSYYDRWVNKEKGIGHVVSQRSLNTAYIFALIKQFS